ncbi:hypothetical protein [Cecembia rubra]|uniref:hypothetical protein n=1 Tax=Cecembia rubra TaxID=1485585 RepID=UPI002715563C|nr:hypothetical protein [Cecembia rubra]
MVIFFPNNIETAKTIRKTREIPFVYLTANSDEATFQKAKETHPYAFISKPFNKLNLEINNKVILIGKLYKEERIKSIRRV